MYLQEIWYDLVHQYWASKAFDFFFDVTAVSIKFAVEKIINIKTLTITFAVVWQTSFYKIFFLV